MPSTCRRPPWRAVRSRAARSSPNAARRVLAARTCAGSVITTRRAQLRACSATTIPSHVTSTFVGDAVTSTRRPIIRGSTE